MAGYSSKSLVQKLNIKENSKLLVLNSPLDYNKLIKDLPIGSKIFQKIDGELEFIQIFVVNKADLGHFFPKLKRVLKKDGALWISWPKKASKLPTDLDENIVREIGLSFGLVDVKVIAIDETWSGLKFVYRLIDRV